MKPTNLPPVGKLRIVKPPVEVRGLFDERPIVLEGFRFVARGVQVVATPSLAQWKTAFQFAEANAQAAPFWLGDLWNYAEGRSEWHQVLPQALAELGIDLKIQTFYNHGSVARRVTGPARVAAPSFKHADVVADLPQDEQIEILTEAADQQLTVQETRNLKRSKKRLRVLEGQAELRGVYRVIYADPPWLCDDSGATRDGNLARPGRHLPSLTVDQLCALPVAAHASKDAVLFMWVTARMLYQDPGPREVIEAWQFTPKTGIVWDMVLHSFGRYVSVCHEHLIIATRGSCLPDAPTPMPDSVQTVRRGDVYSEKPELFRQIIVQLYTSGPYLELFGRRPIEGWDVFGSDPALWGRAIAS